MVKSNMFCVVYKMTGGVFEIARYYFLYRILAEKNTEYSPPYKTDLLMIIYYLRDSSDFGVKLSVKEVQV